MSWRCSEAAAPSQPRDHANTKVYCVTSVFWMLFYVFASPHVLFYIFVSPHVSPASGEMKLKIIAKLQANLSGRSHI